MGNSSITLEFFCIGLWWNGSIHLYVECVVHMCVAVGCPFRKDMYLLCERQLYTLYVCMLVGLSVCL